MADSQFDRLFDMMRDLKQDQDEIKVQTIKNSVVLEEHMKRSEASEARLSIQEDKFDTFVEKMGKDLEPLKDHVKLEKGLVRAVMALLGFASTIVGIVYALSVLHRH